MSVFQLSGSVLTLRPSIVHDRDTLVIQSGFLSRLMALFLLNHKVEILFSTRLVVYHHKLFLFFRKCLYCGLFQSTCIAYGGAS